MLMIVFIYGICVKFPQSQIEWERILLLLGRKGLFKTIIEVKIKFNLESNKIANHEAANRYSTDMRKQRCYLNSHWFLLLSLHLLFLDLFLSLFPFACIFFLTSHSVLQFLLQLFSFFPWLLNILPFTAFIMNEPAMKASVWNQEHKSLS